MIDKILTKPTYKRDGGLWVVNMDMLDIPNDFVIAERNVVYIPPGEYGGNHRHPRKEAMIGIGDYIILIWEDSDGVVHEETMSNKDTMLLFILHPFTPHAVVNKGNKPAMLIEVADGPQLDVEPCNLPL